MSNINEKVNTLISYLTHIRVYRDPLRVRNDTTDVFRFFPNLQPFYAPYNRGQMITLIYLKGTIPINYRGVAYYIPVVIWIPENYPFAPPMVLLDPTPEMEIVKNHPQVSETGMCHHQYLSHWVWQSNICQAVKFLCDIYSGHPPLVSKSKPQPIPMDPNRDSPPPYGSSPKTNLSNNNMSNSYNNNNNSVGGSTSSTVGWNQPPPTYAESLQSPPPLPPKPNTSPPTSTSTTTSAATSSQQLQQQLQQQIQQQQQQLQQIQREQEQREKELQVQREQLREKNEREEALAKCTEKLQVLLSQFYDTTSKEIEEYYVSNASMEERLTQLVREKTYLGKEMEGYKSRIEATIEKNEQLDKWIAENNKESQEIDIDAMSAPKDPLSRQLLSLVSEDATIEDMLYYLDKALSSNRITLEEYLKNVRSLSREQFMIRATIKKVHSHLQANYLQLHQQQQLHHQQPIGI